MITAQEVLLDIWKLISLAFYSVYCWLEVFYHKLFPTYKNVKDEIVLITGAAGGIGSELVKRFVDLGSTVVCVDYNQKELDRLKDELTSSHPDDKDKNNNKRVHFYVLDITNVEQVKDVSARIRREVGDVNILINNAGTVNQAKLLLDLTEQEINRLFQVNILAQFWLVREFLPYMQSKNRGHIVNVASVCGLQGGYKLTDYCSSKFAVVGFTESLRIELNVTNPNNQIEVSVVCPFHVQTKLFDGIVFNKFRWIRLSFTPKEVSDAIVNGVLTNKKLIYVPQGLVQIFLAVKNLSTTRLNDYAQRLLDFSGSMDNFKGNKQL